MSRVGGEDSRNQGEALQVDHGAVAEDDQNASEQFPAGVRDSCPPLEDQAVSEVRKVLPKTRSKPRKVNRVLQAVGSLPRGIQQSVLAVLPIGDDTTGETDGPNTEPSPPPSSCMFGDSDVLLIDHESAYTNEPRRRLAPRRAPTHIEREDTVRRDGVYRDDGDDELVVGDDLRPSDNLDLDIGVRPSDDLDLDMDLRSIAGLDPDSLTAGDNTTVAAPIPVRRWPWYAGIGVALLAVVAVLGWTVMALQPSQHSSQTKQRSVVAQPAAAPAAPQVMTESSKAVVDEAVAQADEVLSDEVLSDEAVDESDGSAGQSTPYGEIPLDAGAASGSRSSNSVSSKRRRLSKKQVRLGLVRQRRRQDKAALWHFERALSLDPHNDEAMRHLGQHALEQENLDDSAVWAYRSVQADKRNVGAWLLLGTVQEQRGQLAGALNAYKEVLHLSRRNRTARARVKALSEQVSATAEESSEEVAASSKPGDETGAVEAREAKRRRAVRRRARRRARKRTRQKRQTTGQQDGVKLLSFGG